MVSILLVRAWNEREAVLFGATSVLLLVGSVAYPIGAGSAATTAWVVATLLGLLHSVASIVEAIRQRQPSVDVIALLALLGALLVDEAFAGAVIAVMLSSGVLLEARAAARARRELSLLASRAPRTARRVTPHGVAEVAVAEIVPGDRLLVGSGEIVPVDGDLIGAAILDESALTGEPLPVEREPGANVRSGVVNAGSPLELFATTTAERSTYAGVVRLVAQAQAGSAPFVRFADRLAVAFVPLTLLLAAVAWAATGEPVRAVAVLVVATPCPLLLAAPIAIMSGLSRAARVGVVIKGGSALERLAAGTVLLFDKTGTLTGGRPVLTAVLTSAQDTNARETNAGDTNARESAADAHAGGTAADEVLRLAASLDQASAHVLAGAIVTAARQRGLALEAPQDAHEHHGYGAEGTVAGKRIKVGKAAWACDGGLPAWARQATRRAALDGSLTVFVSIDGVPAGALLFEDPVRPDAPRMVRTLRTAGITRVVLVTGDRTDMAGTVGRIVGVDTVHAEHDPADKLAVVRAEQSVARTIMVGDGINDAPALAAAGVGVALAARGTTASSEAADVVLTVDRVDAVADGIIIARRSRRIAGLSVAVGMGLSAAAMVVAAIGLLPPAAGALLQELIDVAAIGIALTALLPGPLRTVALSTTEITTARRLHNQHLAVRAVVEQVRVVADGLTSADHDITVARVLLDRLENQLLPHERADQTELLPIIARALGGSDPTGALSRAHAEIEHQVGLLHRVLDDVGADPSGDDIIELRRLLYGLYAVLRLHNAQEEDAFSLVPDQPHTPETTTLAAA